MRVSQVFGRLRQIQIPHAEQHYYGAWVSVMGRLWKEQLAKSWGIACILKHLFAAMFL